MEMLKNTLYKKRYSLVGCLMVLPVLLLVTTRFRIAATDAQIKNMLNVIEVFYPFFVSLFVCCIIPRKTEAELIVLSGGSLLFVALYEFIAYLTLSLISGEIAGLFLLPAWMRLQFALSFPVTLLTVLSMALCVRFVINNIYANLGVHTVLFMLVYLNSGMGPDALVTRTLTKIDLFVNGYSHMIYSDAGGNWYLRFGDVLINRIIFLAVSTLIFALALLLSRQSRLYNIKRE